MPKQQFIPPKTNDRRIHYTKQFLDAFNSCDSAILRSLLCRYCFEDVEAIHRYDGINNPYGTNYRQLRSISSISTLWDSLFESAPDFSFMLLSTKLIQNSSTDEGDVCIVESMFTFSGTRVMDVAIQRSVTGASIPRIVKETNIKDNDKSTVSENSTQNISSFLKSDSKDSASVSNANRDRRDRSGSDFTETSTSNIGSIDSDVADVLEASRNMITLRDHQCDSSSESNNNAKRTAPMPPLLHAIEGDFQFRGDDVSGLQRLSSVYYNTAPAPAQQQHTLCVPPDNIRPRPPGCESAANSRPNLVSLTCKVDPNLLSVFAQQCASGIRGGASLVVEDQQPPSSSSRSSSCSGDTDNSTASR